LNYKLIWVSITAIFLGGCNQNVQSKNERPVLDPQNTEVELSTNDRDNPSSRLKNMSKIAIVEKEKPKHPSGMVASLVGHLEFRENCIVVIAEGGDIEQPVFPSYSVSWDEATNTLIYESKRYKDGDPISLTGGGVNESFFGAQEKVYLPECPNSSLFVVAG